MDGCQALPPVLVSPLCCDLSGAALPPSDSGPTPGDGGAMTGQRPTPELDWLPTAAASDHSGATDSEASPLNFRSPEHDVQRRPGDLLPNKSEHGDIGDSPTSTLRSCLRRPRPSRRRSDAGAIRGALLARRRGSEAPPPRPRRVHFPSRAVTARIPPSDPLRLMGADHVTTAYLVACGRHASQPLPAVLEQLADPSTDVLRLTGTPLLLADMDSLEEVFRRRQWRRVDAADCGLHAETLSALLQIVTHYDSTPWLNLTGAAPGRVGWAAVCAAVRAAGVSSALQWLSLDLSSPNETAAAALGRSLRTSGLRVLHLERSQLHGRPLALLAAGLRHCPGLRQLYLGDNELGAGDGSLLGGALRHNIALQLLDVRNNLLNDDAVGYLLAGIAEQPAAPNVGLLTLNLWHNRLTENAAEPLAALLATHPALETLNLGGNALGESAAALLAVPLGRDGPLRRLGLQSCGLGPEAAGALGRALAADSGLVRLDLRGNRLGVAGLRALLDGVRGNTALRQLDLDQEPGPEVTGEEFGPGWERGDERGSPDRADSGIDSPAKSSDGDGGALLGLAADGGALSSSLDSPLGSSADSDPPAGFPADSRGSAASQSGSDSAVGGSPSPDTGADAEFGSLLASLSAVCEANRRRPAAEPVASPPPAEDGPPAGHWLRRRLSAALRRVSLTCETPARLTPSPASPPTPAPVPEKPRHRKLISPSPSPSESPLPSPTSGRSRFRVFRVSAAEAPPGTPPLTRGLPRSSAESERTPSLSPSREGLWCGAEGATRAERLGKSPPDGDQCGDCPSLSSSHEDQWGIGSMSPPGEEDWRRSPSPSPRAKSEWGVSPGSSPSVSGWRVEPRLQGGGCTAAGQDWRPVPRSSPRPAGRKFRVTPVRETPGPA